MQNFGLSLLFLIILFFIEQIAQANIFLKPTGTTYDSTDENAGSKTTTSRTVGEMSFGYIFSESGWTAFGNYSTEKMLSKIEGVGSSQTDSSRTSYGAGIGWISRRDSSGPFGMVTYYPTSDYTRSTLLYKGFGYQLDAGMRFNVGKAFLALQLSYRSFEYSKYTVSTLEFAVSPSRKQVFLDPMAALFIEL